MANIRAFQACDESSILSARTKKIRHLRDVLFSWSLILRLNFLMCTSLIIAADATNRFAYLVTKRRSKLASSFLSVLH